MPISWVRRATCCASTPYTPIAASSSASPANAPINQLTKRGRAICRDTRSSIVATLNTVAPGSTPRIVRRTVSISVSGGTAVRSITAKERTCGRNGWNTSGSFVSFTGSRRIFVSRTTPTIRIQGAVESGAPYFMRLPMGSCPGQNRSTSRSLTMIGVGAAGPTPWRGRPSSCISASVKSRPAISLIPIVSKNPGTTR